MGRKIKPTPTPALTFDYIVLGAGSAGAIVAKKLSDNRSNSVLLLEAGTNMTSETLNPQFEDAEDQALNNRFAYNALTKREPVLNEQQAYQSGRLVGGGTQHNGSYATRGSKELYDEWAQMVGSQWSYKSVLPLFKEFENYTGSTQKPNQRGRNGPIFVRQELTKKNGTVGSTYAKATQQVTGVPLVDDYNTGINGCTFVRSQYYQKVLSKNNIIRQSTATGYLNASIVTQSNEFNSVGVGVNRNLLLITKATVNRVLLRKVNGGFIAYAVEFVDNGVSKVAYANKEIIVSSGNYSPVILQRSGIGGRQDLLRAGIEPILINENVGRNMQSHYALPMGIEIETSRLLQILRADPNQPFVFGAFLNRRSKTRSLQLQTVYNSFYLPASLVSLNNWKFNPKKPSNVMSMSLVILNPPSLGFVRAAHTDPEAYPEVQLNYFVGQQQFNEAVDAYLITYNIIRRARKLDPKGLFKVVAPAEEIFQIKNKDRRRIELLRFSKSTVRSYTHYAGQCRMSRSKADGVVDGHLRVHGVKNLRIADLCIAPKIPDGNPATAAMMIGLNCARFIQSNQ
ncbi:GMC family oxidoreductase [Polycladospora coralii]|uniref:GMC family oxidoreductase n=1 Tax=Polycladospora coralii TaxID=2771432 RepID=UPI001CD14D2D|nr:GMC family oxidoreductase [Polycladospora coralii]